MIKNKIDELLKQNGLTFGTIAEKIGVKRTTLLYNLANPKVPLKYLIQIAQALNVDVSDLFEEDNVDISGYIKYNDMFFDLNLLNDFVSFTSHLVKDCGLETDLFYEQKKNLKSNEKIHTN